MEVRVKDLRLEPQKHHALMTGLR